ncbi:TetR/AcrR family transcriptional regulator [Streptomyces sp. NPDC127106]|uniref:TetR/AcrR family transcriptional regulator n=1 Tax=Streptomyces sp. NPDC127106 TaxID=3345360 RepID=UPI00363461FE
MTRETGRPLRADAQRNREKLLEAAVRVFAEQGLGAHRERIAKEAGVGAGTLYRNFPTREALIEAAYRNELAKLCEAVPELLGALPPHTALRTWMARFIDYTTAKLGMAEALRAVVDAGVNPYAESRERIQGALASLLEAGVATGAVRSDVSAADALVALTGIALTCTKPDQRDQAERLLDLLYDGLTAKRS